MLAARALQTIREREAAGFEHAVDAQTRAAFLAFVGWWLDAGLPLSPDDAADAFDALVASA